MRAAIARAWAEHRVLFVAFCLLVAITLFFAVRLVMFSLYWNDPRHRDQALEGWMTPRYVAHSWAVPPEVVSGALGLAPGGGRITLDDIARERGVPVEVVEAELLAAIRGWREANR